MKAKLLTVLSFIVVLTLMVGPVLALTPQDSAAVTASTSTTPLTTTQPDAVSQSTAASKPEQVSGPFVSESIVPGSFNGDLRSLPASIVRGKPGQPIPEEIPNRETVGPKGAERGSAVPDPVAQRDAGSGDMPSPLVTFPALSNQDNFAIFSGRVNPPDTNGAVGPNHYIQMVNLVWAIFDKAGNRLFGPAKPSAIFAAAGTGTPCDTNNNGDPIVLYDSGADRWLISQFAFTNSTVPPFFECIAVSKGPNPVTDGWWTYVIRINDNFPDYPKLSVWPDAYYYTARMFSGTRPFFLSATALERSAMLAGRPARYVKFELPGNYDSPLPTNWRGEAPPTGTPALIALADDVTDSIVTWQFHVDWDNPANSTLTPEYKVAVAPFDTACPATRRCVPFSGSTATTMVDALSPRLMFGLEYRRTGSTESVWATQTITESGRAVVRWYELRYARAGSVITPTVFQQGSYAPTDGVWRWMGSLAADKDGNMAIGYSASSPSIDPQIRYTGRLATDTTGFLAQGEVTMTIGTGHPTSTNNRWGDYSAMTVDPVDDCTFWYTQEYYTTTTGIAGDNRPWTTAVGAFKYPSCTPLAAAGRITGTVYDATSLALLPNVPVQAVDAAQNRIYAGSTDATGHYTLTVQAGTYAVSGGPLAYIGYPVAGTVSGVSVASSGTGTANIPLNGAPYLQEGTRTYNDAAQGNGNGFPEPGEKNIALTEVLSNTGVTTATNIVATLTSLTPGFMVITGTASYPNIAAGSAATNLTPFTFSLDSSLACGTVGNFRKVVVAAEGTYTIPFTLKLGITPGYTCTFAVPNLIVASAVGTESGGNTNGNGYIEPGENSINASVTLSNTGLTNIGPATNVNSLVTALTPGVTMNVSSSPYPNIAANSSAANSLPFNFAVSSSVACGAALDFGLHITTTEGTYNRSFQLLTGQPLAAPITILSDTVEAGQGVWITTSNLSGVGFAITTEDAHSPTHSWTDSPGAQYPNGLDTSLISPVYDFTAFDQVRVNFWQKYSTEAGFDYGQVEYSTDGGTSWTVAAAYDGVQATWLNTTVDLSAGLAHKANARIRFHFIADSGVVDNGWWLDDFSITGQRRVCPAQLQVAHLAPFANTLAGTSVTVTLDSTPVLTDFVYGESSGYLSVLDGVHLVEVYAGSSATPAITANVVLSENLSYSAIAIGDGVNQPLSLLGLLDDTTPVSGSAKVRIGHLAPFASGAALADVRLQDGTPILTNVAFSQVSPYLTLPAGTYDLKITAPGGTPTLIDPLPVALASNSIQSVFATGDGVKQPLGAFAWANNQAGSFLPLSAWLAVAHLAPFANTLAGTSVTVTLDTLPVLTNVKYGDSTGYLAVAAGPHLVEIYPGASATPAITANVVLSANLSYSAVAIGDGVNQPLGLQGLLDDTTPVPGFAKVRIGHLAPFASGAALADVRLQDGTPVITNVPFSLVSAYLSLPAGTYDLKITAPGGTPTLIDPLPVALASNSIQSVFATGDGVNQPLGAFAWPSNQAGMFLPLATYGVTVVPPTSAQSQYVGKVVTYTLWITNTSNTIDAFTISSIGNLWTVGVPAAPIQLASGGGAQFNVTVSVPLTATNNLTDTATITAISLSDPTKTSSVVLTTTAKKYLINLPLILR